MKYDRALSCLQQAPPPKWSGLRRLLQLSPVARIAHRIARSVPRSKGHSRSITENSDIVGVVVQSDAFRGKFEMDPRGHLLDRILAKRWETHLATFISEILEPDDDVIDVGANIGLFSVLAARTATQGRVLAIEPSPDASAFLKGNLVRNDVKNVIVFDGAAAAEQGSETLHVIPGLTEYSSLGQITHPAVADRRHVAISVAARTVDELVAQHQLHPKLMKIDVEGAEHDVLRGAGETLSTHRPLLVSEIDCRLLPNRGTSAESIRELLAENEYELFNAETGAALRQCAGFVGEIVALPNEWLNKSGTIGSSAPGKATSTGGSGDASRRTEAA